MLDLIIVPTLELGDRSYIVHDGRRAIVIDPQRDIDRMLAILAERGLEAVAVGDTHMHNDYVTGGYALAKELDVDYLVFEGEQVHFERRAVADREVLRLGDMEVTVLHTPGHTPTHISFVVRDPADDRPPVLLSGGSLLYGSVGRTDLISPEATYGLAKDQWHSAQRFATELPGPTILMPTHGFGSFCSSVSVEEAGDSTLDGEKRVNIVYKYDSAESFADMLVATYDPFPAYYRHMGPANVSGPAPLRIDSLPKLDVAQVTELRDHHEAAVVDIRPRKQSLEGRPAGTLAFEYSNVFSTYLGWLHHYGRPIVLVSSDEATAREAALSLGRIGIDEVRGWIEPEPLMDAWGVERLERISWQEYVQQYRGSDHTLLDLRNPSEARALPIPGAIQIPIYFLPNQIDEVATDRTVVVHCAGGYRAAAGAAWLSANKHIRPVVIDDGADVGAQLLAAQS
ncbi:beta-lactamase domain protein [Acidimicrobium ferrooxidans DSM 10331]|uniref:Beta-lactamase domain protein n=1 Tax=Acidimicrobium ferrooxidans (strain DSM 10331 / JCM 15462 / NBRC 103882 / ICP) TaxID=525909 RepID=C7LYZ4_ACIFD|nr:MBL fold metallo-hydrolase [Acidimicrobium ferrooxidans]ACU53952.1 beta-lactamase domain protein [Acidimicrobium ferrooxidans DSM 10331]